MSGLPKWGRSSSTSAIGTIRSSPSCEGEAAIQDTAGNEIVRHGAAGFLGELNLMSGQTVFLRAVATQPMRYLAVERDAFRP